MQHCQAHPTCQLEAEGARAASPSPLDAGQCLLCPCAAAGGVLIKPRQLRPAAELLLALQAASPGPLVQRSQLRPGVFLLALSLLLERLHPQAAHVDGGVPRRAMRLPGPAQR